MSWAEAVPGVAAPVGTCPLTGTDYFGTPIRCHKLRGHSGYCGVKNDQGEMVLEWGDWK